MAVTLLNKALTAFFQTISINSKLYFTSYSTQQGLNTQVNTSERNRRHKTRVNILRKCWHRIQTVHDVCVLSAATTAWPGLMRSAHWSVQSRLYTDRAVVGQSLGFKMNSSSMSTNLVSHPMHESRVVVLKWSEWRTSHHQKLNHGFPQ